MTIDEESADHREVVRRAAAKAIEAEAEIANEPRSEVVDEILDHQHELIGADEVLVAGLLAGRTDSVKHSGKGSFSIYGMLGGVGRSIEQALGEREVRVRDRQVNLMLHRKGVREVALPETKIGYAIGLTNHRMLVFSENGKQFLTESPLANMRLDVLEHADDMTSLVFCEGSNGVAVTSWEDDATTDHFVATFYEMQVKSFSQENGRS